MTISENSGNEGFRARLAAAEAEVIRLRELLSTADLDAHRLHSLLASDGALALWRKETRETKAALVASAVALRSSRAATAAAQTELLASAAALTAARAETRECKLALVASGLELAASRAETRESKADLLSIGLALALSPEQAKAGEATRLRRAVALALSRAETNDGHAQKLAVIGRITAGVAHDFNNLLLELSGSLELLLDAVADQPVAVECGNLALRAATRGKELTDRLLSFSRNQLLIARTVTIEDLFRDLRELIDYSFETSARGKPALVMMPCAQGLSVMADLAQLEVVLVNLAMNARDTMDAGGLLRFSAYAADADPAIVPPGHYTVISIADTGNGMDAETLAKACKPFLATEGSRETGAGLSMVQGFALQSGGNAHVTSVVGEGTTIDIWLPSGRLPVEIQDELTTPAPSAGRILLVDDSPDALIVVSAFLQAANLDVTTKVSGDLALAELADGQRFDAIITDIAMPGMNGVELLALSREIDPSMAGMLISGFSESEMLPQIDDVVVLRKPFNRAELIQSVQGLLAAKRAVRASKDAENPPAVRARLPTVDVATRECWSRYSKYNDMFSGSN